uniref:Uncharacterized protein YjcR n=1 Tax=Candidatus Kentrum sp. FM TaxID=2126340 RepID=A0A450VLM2_9GAMM|nr:MAG: Uncharacterized protein YjcR [Candidatus Kentron sp. FM]VFJ43622.1 MAG: Uncharacterized protein YjcR [Candidatus Kentron sp. FM]VFK05641.1 MAG: Uncharacterized protein YjcR [Candidatus Kentron sp. FM]
MAAHYGPDKRAAARALYLQGIKIPDIRRALEIGTERVIQQWRKKEGWDDLLAPVRVEEAIAARVIRLTDKEEKTGADLSELDRLAGLLARFEIDKAKADKIRAEADSIRAGGDGAGRGRPPNKTRREQKGTGIDISDIGAEKLEAFAQEHLYPYQLEWRKRGKDPATRRNRFILKSRQIGATYYFAFEALEDAILTGENQIFLSASRPQAEIFRAYIIAFAHEIGQITLRGNPIKLSNGAMLIFVSTNASTAQGYSGNLYCDEVFWWPGDFENLYKSATGMASRKKFRRTFISTPSVKTHGAYSRWSGREYNRNRPEKDRRELDLSHEALKAGQLGPDRIWRQIVTLEDAQEQGNDEFDTQELRDEYGKESYNNLFSCVFLDETQSIFKLAELLVCTRDSTGWTHIRLNTERPLGNRPVAIGFDPSRSRDPSCVALLETPLTPQGPWRFFDSLKLHGQRFINQALEIAQLYERYNIIHCGVDVTGLGVGVYEELEKKHLAHLVPIHYSNEIKNMIVINMMGIIERQRFEYPDDRTDVTQSFLMVHRQSTQGGAITYAANRTAETGHADLFWAIAHGAIMEKLNAGGSGEDSGMTLASC